MFKIDNHIPAPPERHKAVGSITAAMSQLEVGQSFFVPGKVSGSMGGYTGALKPKRFSTRNRTEGGVDGVRIWRIE